MKKTYFILSLLIIPFIATATQPCNSPTKQWFINNVVQKTDLIVYASIIDYSKEKQFANKNTWTNIKILETLHGNTDKTILHINNWQAYFFPLYNHKKNDHLLLFLKENGKNYEITELSWEKCVPSVVTIHPNDKHFIAPFSPHKIEDTKDLCKFIDNLLSTKTN